MEQMSFDDTVYFYARAVAWKYNNNRLPNYGTVIALHNNDYSGDENALICNSNNPFTINTTCEKRDNETYKLTLNPSEQCTIYYTRNGTTPTKESKVYNNTLIIYESTWIQYFGINKNNQTTPILSFGIHRPSTPYITNIPQLSSNNYENIVNLATSQKSTIYYTLDGTKPTTNSSKYTSSIKIHNNTILQYFSVTESKNKISPIYFYKLQNPTPFITVLNTTEVNNNYQNISIIGNKPGTIYYTRNGTTPTNKSLEYKKGTQIKVSVNTQVNAILIDKNGKVSQILKYQSPQIITLPIITVQILMPEDAYNNQKIYFDVNENQETYYTTDNSNPKNSSSRKIAKYPLSSPIDGINITNNTIVKYYTKDTLLGFQSDVYTYKPVKNKYEQEKITILNTTPLYKNGAENTKEEQKIKIQRNRYCPLETKQEEETYLIYTYNDKEFILNKTSNILIKEKNYGNEAPWNHRILNYNITNGLKTRMNYTYTLKIPYQNIKISINSKTILNLKNTNLANKYYLYDYNTKTYSITTNTTTTLNKPGTLIYLNNSNIVIKNYEYTYGETNQVSLVKEGMGNNTIKVSAINNGIKNEICTIYIPNLNQKITWGFISNDFYKEDTYSENLNSEKIKNKEIESITTFVLANQKTIPKIINEWIQKYSIYNKSVYKSAYGTFMTGLTHMYLYNSISTLLEYKLNLTTIVTRNTQMKVSINSDGYTQVNINDEDFGRTIIGENETNIKIYKFISGFMGSYLEGVVLHLGGDKNAGSAAVYFIDDYFSNKTLQFEYDNQTNQVKITTENNTDYEITLSPNGWYCYSIAASRTPQKTIKTSTNNENQTNETIIYDELNGGCGTKGFGSKYESTATDNIVDFLRLALENLFEFGLNYTENFFNQTLNVTLDDGFWTVVNTGEDLAGTLLITSGLAVFAASSSFALPAIAVIGGIGLCYAATGVNSIDDIFNPYYAFSAAPSILLSLVPLGYEAKILKLGGESVIKQLKVAGKIVLAKRKQNSYFDYLKEETYDYLNQGGWNAFVETCGYEKG